ncbi:alpha/beta fold hydrolase [Microbacterium aurantiacum]|uniref:alpha/beta fold hydrolase n=1 Tax=Microbacterium aurantiacum TaxID=162393 RepID=UPI004037591D
MSRGSFWVTADRVPTPAGSVLRGPMYVEWEVPDGATKTPVVLVHGGGGQGTDYLTTPDGRPGWAPLLVQHGHPVYIVDRPGHGRSPYDPAVLGQPAPTWGAEVLAGIFLGDPAGPPLPPHTRWPGELDGSDDVFEQFIATQGPLMADTSAMHSLERDRLIALLDRIGPAFVVAHSAGGPGAYLAADARPDLVRGLAAVETIGPPFLGQPQAGITLPWGLAAAAPAYDPPASTVEELRLVVDSSGPVPKALQEEPARMLPGLAQVPIAIVTAQASPFRFFDGHLKDYLDQAGCSSVFLRLEDAGIEGNGHGMMLESNNAEVLAVITDWFAQLVGKDDGATDDRR